MANYYEENYRALLPDDRQAPIMDIGCGQGDFVRFAHSLGYRNITAVDADERVLTSLSGFSGVSSIRRRIGEELPTELVGPWKLIVAKQMIYYFDRRQAARLVRSLAGALTTDGRLVVEIFNGSLLSSRFTELKDPDILTAYTELGLRRLLEQNGLQVLQVVGATGGGSALYRFLRWIWIELYRLLLILERGRDDELPQIGHKSVIAIARRA